MKNLFQKVKYKYHYYNHILRWKLNHYLSLQNRQKVITSYLSKNKVAKLQLGCGPFKLKGWLNTELFGSKDLVSLNLLKKFPIRSNSFDFVYSEHTIEHFSFDKAEHIMKESYRVLKKGGVVRVATPNLLFLFCLYNKDQINKDYLDWTTKEFNLEAKMPSFAINNFVRSWGHEFIYDYQSLSYLLKKAGFKNIKRYSPGDSEYNELKNVEHHWKSFSEQFNNLETITLEGEKL